MLRSCFNCTAIAAHIARPLPRRCRPGTSPEFEFALYTLYFLAGSERNNAVIDGYEVCIRCYAIKSKYGDKVSVRATGKLFLGKQLTA